MPDSPQAIWWIFIRGGVAALILLLGVIASVVLSQRRYLNLHRSHARGILELSAAEAGIELLISDSGQGFDPAQDSRAQGNSIVSHTKILVVTMHSDRVLADAALQAGFARRWASTPSGGSAATPSWSG